MLNKMKDNFKTTLLQKCYINIKIFEKKALMPLE